MEKEEKTQQTEESNKEINVKFSLWFYIAIVLCAIVFIIVSAVTKNVCYWAAAIGFALLFAEFLRLYIKSRKVMLIVVAAVSFAAFALTFTLWIMQLCI